MKKEVEEEPPRRKGTWWDYADTYLDANGTRRYNKTGIPFDSDAPKKLSVKGTF